MKKVYCINCKYEKPDARNGLEPCKIHPYSRTNRGFDCKDYKRKWWKFWIV